ncbi:MAG TPA: FAD-dependent oxidoreductase [Actinomycetes bacterium]|nr:FAD-dependent oxidoreductase [Actinomycetes bacterium]
MDGPRVSRRALLVAGVLGAAAVGADAVARRADDNTRRVASPVRTSARPDVGTRKRVVVVGAGLAGLSCALTLLDQGWDVDVIEARDRVGGRVHTLRDAFGVGTHVEMGAEFIDRDHHVLLGLLDRFGLGTDVRDKSQRVALSWDGRRADYSARVERRGGDLYDDIQLVTDATARLAAQVDPENPERSEQAERLDAMSLAQWADRLGMTAVGRRVWEAGFIVSDYGTASKDISLLFYAQQENFGSSSDAVVEALRVHGGNQGLAEAMASYLARQSRVRLRLGEPVVSVRTQPGLAMVRTATGVYPGAHVVIASPPPTLSAIAFDPALPPPIQEAVNSSLLDDITKVVVPYRGHPWRRAGWTGESLTDLTYTYSWDATDSTPSAPNGALVAFTGGGAAGRTITHLTPEKRVALVEAQLRRVFPEVLDHEDHRYPAATMAWADEPFTGGGYANYRPGQMLTAKPAFRRAHGPLRFAGEHTEAMGQYMESAVRSGLRVAKDIGLAPHP